MSFGSSWELREGKEGEREEGKGGGGMKLVNNSWYIVTQ